MATTTIIALIICSMIITSIINFVKEWMSWITKKKVLPVISMGLAFVLWLIAAFSFDLWAEYSVWAKVLLWLALGTWSTIFYDIRELIKSLENKSE